MAELARRDRPLSRDVILLATPDEEVGGRDGAGFLTRRHRGLLGDAEFLLTEGGGILVSDDGGPNVWGVSVAEKAPCWTRLTAKGTGGHASTGGTHGPVPRLVAALERVRRIADGSARGSRSREHVRGARAARRAGGSRRLSPTSSVALATDPEFRRRFLADESRAALVRNTIAITVLRAGSAPNVVPEEAVAELDVRLLPGERCDEFLERAARRRSRTRASASTRSSRSRRAARPPTPRCFRAIERRRGGDRPARARRAARDRGLHRRALLPRARHRLVRLRAALAPAERDPRRPRPQRTRLDREPGARHRSDRAILEALGR